MVCVHFLPDNITTEAQVGELILDVASRCGITIPTGCLMGTCHACEVEIDDGNAIRACITAVPKRSHLTINLYSDPTW
ncbi:2Fe-2S iron-sulfur cluster-binding protein [Synechocystis sp. PCC 7509]|uniref:2Fe-2S iron-sulfur cluster-binding protein n=1 Tax=Synechocystis sp. PCC 7509 TaxID=927677 RepID=UPI0002ABF61D